MTTNTVVVVHPQIQTVTIASKGIQGPPGPPGDFHVVEPIVSTGDTIQTISIPAATILSPGHATPAHIQAINENSTKVSYTDKEKIDAYPSMPAIPSDQYLSDEGTFKPIAVGSGSYAANLYLSNTDSITPGYKRLSYSVDGSEVTKTIIANSGTTQGEKYLFDNGIGITTINSGNWINSIRRKVDTPVGNSVINIRVFMYTLDGIENNLFTLTSTDINDFPLTIHKDEITRPQFNCNVTDRLGIQISFTTNLNGNVTLSYNVGDGYAAYLLTPLSIRHTSLRQVNEDPEVQHMTSSEKGAIGKLKISPSGLKPSPSLDNSGMIWRTAGGVGVADTVEICLKNDTDNYMWVSII